VRQTNSEALPDPMTEPGTAAEEKLVRSCQTQQSTKTKQRLQDVLTFCASYHWQQETKRTSARKRVKSVGGGAGIHLFN